MGIFLFLALRSLEIFLQIGAIAVILTAMAPRNPPPLSRKVGGGMAVFFSVLVFISM